MKRSARRPSCRGSRGRWTMLHWVAVRPQWPAVESASLRLQLSTIETKYKHRDIRCETERSLAESVQENSHRLDLTADKTTAVRIGSKATWYRRAGTVHLHPSLLVLTLALPSLRFALFKFAMCTALSTVGAFSAHVSALVIRCVFAVRLRCLLSSPLLTLRLCARLSNQSRSCRQSKPARRGTDL
jgi:hypothetical protein